MASRVMRYRTPKRMAVDDPRKRLIETGLDLFGKYSFDGASTRMLAEGAQVNLAAITYYFGGKDGLYLAVADYIVEEINGLVGPCLVKAREAAEREGLSREQGIEILCELVEFFITLLLGRPGPEKWLSFIVREQLCPTEAFGILYEGFMRPMYQALFGLVARIMGEGPEDQEVKLRVIAILGQIQIFHISPSAVKRTLGWESYGPENLEAVRCVVMDNLRRIFSIVPNCSSNGSDAWTVL